MHRDTGRISAGFVLSLSLCILAMGAAAFAAPPASDSKTDCSKQTTASGEKPKDCDKISPERMSTKAKADQQTMGSTSNTAGSTSSSKSSLKMEKKTSNKDADAISKDRMSTRGLKPPPKDTTTDKSDAKSSASSDPNNPK